MNDDTPRTDQIEATCQYELPKSSRGEGFGEMTAFARRLERELAALQSQLALVEQQNFVLEERCYAALELIPGDVSIRELREKRDEYRAMKTDLNRLREEVKELKEWRDGKAGPKILC